MNDNNVISSNLNTWRCKLEHETIDKEIKQEEQLETNIIFGSENIEEIKAQKAKYGEKTKGSYETNKDIIKERSNERYAANKDISEFLEYPLIISKTVHVSNKEKAKTRYEANKDIIKKRSKARYIVNKDKAKARYEAKKHIIKEKSRARYAANRETIKEKYKKQRNIDGNIKFKNVLEIKNNIKKWTLDEEKDLIRFLKENIESEKPTAQTVLKCFLQNSGVNADWKMVRSKVFNMRTTYYKTKDWLNTIGETITDDAEVKNVIYNKCRFYYDLEEIFESKSFNLSQSNNNSETISEKKSNKVPITIIKTENEEFQNICENMAIDESSISVSESLSSRADGNTTEQVSKNISTATCSGVCFRLTVSKMAQNRREILGLGMKKITYNKILREKEMQLLQRQVAVLEKELELEEKEIKSQEHLKILELEMKERIATAELELKYKN